MKKILFITVSAPGNHGGGGEVYTAELLRELSSFCQIDLVYFRYADGAKYESCSANVNVLLEQIIDKKFKVKGFLSKPLVFPFFSARYSKAISTFLKERIEKVKYDALYFDHSQTFAYVKDLSHPCKILMCHDIVAQKYSRSKSFFSGWVRNSEKKLLSYGNKVFTLSEKDCDLIRTLYKLESSSTSLYISENVLKTTPTQIGDYFVMFGAWGRPENYLTLQWMIKYVIPWLSDSSRIKVIGGGKMPEDIKAQIEQSPMLEYVGFVDNPYPVIANAIAEIAPLKYGAGVKVKCVEALACGAPVIGTEVAFEGIPVYAQTRELMLQVNNAEEVLSAMKSINIGIEKRLEAKKIFCEKYSQKSIVEFIKILE